ncbi:MAG TPA: DUF1269 domain-containing protein [Verrucomicrobiae bacterium]|nr:DUF1269 domain-containing protein [Verrucomicrobiae bacterium]
MSHLIALVFDNRLKGEEVLAALHRVVGEGLLEIQDSVLVTKRLDGQTQVVQEDNVIHKGQKTGHAAGLMAAAVTGAVPFIPTGMVDGRLVGKLMDHGIAHKFVKTVKQEIDPGTSVLILLADSDPEQRRMIIDRLRLYGPHVVESGLPAELEREIEEGKDKDAA